MFKVTLPDSKVVNSELKESWLEFIKREIGAGLAKAAVAVSINDKMVDVSSEVQSGEMKVVTAKTPDGLEIIRHSTSHVMADAVQKLFPGTKVTIGPAIENGFYYDFDSTHRFSGEDFEAIEQKMQEIVKARFPFIRKEVSKEEAVELFTKMGENFKVEIIKELDEPVVSLYFSGDFVDLCRGPHIPDTGFIKTYKLMSVAGAYWRGNEKNVMLQRIYATAFSTKEELEAHLLMLEEAKERDHRKIGADLDLFSFSESVGSGLVLWTPSGGVVRTVIENFWRKQHTRNGYELVFSPHLGRAHLWELSGHLDFYKESMYSPMDVDGEDYYAKPMNCPFHLMLYKRKKWSYREFPFRWAELGTVYRYEKSGTLNGLKRVRGFTQDDAHLFCRVDQLESEVKRVLDFSLFMLRSFEFKDFKLFLSTRPEKFVGVVELWDKAEDALKNTLVKSGLAWELNEGDGAFYGPKIDIHVTDSIGRNWQLTTIQVDFNEPERFDITYIGEDNKEHRPIMIHRALLGSMERFFGVLIEHFKGAFPLWLSPVQVAVLSVAERHIPTAAKLAEMFAQNNMRAKLDDRNEKIGYKIREWVVHKTPYIVVVGDNEADLKMINVRKRDGLQEAVTVTDFIDKLNKENFNGVYY
ncbi:MAG: threonine--tRNA ligase [bacterium]